VASMWSTRTLTELPYQPRKPPKPQLPSGAIAVSRCAFYEGEHVFAGPDCPHGLVEDELGEIHPPGWTVQG
jgi:hypothetical protein